MNSVASSSSRAGGCGCGGSTASSCHCGKATCGTCNLEGFTRPRFFSGQLLTEEDLQLLDAYAVAKNRLHNSQFFGDGVVCGLEVTKHPCDEGKVIVSPGYALDCCGNDIVVACKQELDVNKLVRALSLSKKGGYDCGDPCAEKTATPPTTTGSGSNPAGPRPASLASSSLVMGSVPSTTNVGEEDIERPVAAKYCLYVSYCESESDPVAPYATGDSCGSQGCQASRVREGFRFELRCDETVKARPSIQTALCKCVKDEEQIRKHAAALRILRKYEARHLAAIEFSKAPKPVDGSTVQFDEFEQANATFVKVLAAQRPAAEKLDAVLRAAEPMITTGARLIVQPAQEPEKTTGKKRAAVSRAADVQRAVNLASVARLVKESAAELQERTPAERIDAELIATDASLVAAALQGGAIDDRKRLELSSGLFISPELDAATNQLLGEVRSELGLPAALPRFDIRSNPGEPRKVLAVILWHQSSIEDKYRECLCSAVLTPCNSCADDAVRIACITVAECEVVSVCNLDRRFVLTPANLRYWVPEIDRVGDALHAKCCGGRPEGLEGRTIPWLDEYIRGLFEQCRAKDKGTVAEIVQQVFLQSKFDGIRS